MASAPEILVFGLPGLFDYMQCIHVIVSEMLTIHAGEN